MSAIAHGHSSDHSPSNPDLADHSFLVAHLSPACSHWIRHLHGSRHPPQESHRKVHHLRPSLDGDVLMGRGSGQVLSLDDLLALSIGTSVEFLRRNGRQSWCLDYCDNPPLRLGDVVDFLGALMTDSQRSRRHGPRLAERSLIGVFVRSGKGYGQLYCKMNWVHDHHVGLYFIQTCLFDLTYQHLILAHPLFV